MRKIKQIWEQGTTTEIAGLGALHRLAHRIEATQVQLLHIGTATGVVTHENTPNGFAEKNPDI